ncbi:hypothetical protein [Larkinella rosea]|uniref:T9SS C-terminal target domain-containing protein n=1 Tax=Larkinella rosea TaxID=2025312 RepID=A0A3P1BLR2_9BACT|nr:hypothetical protein [Larkinella rosea]RRB02030.1 hypothetical protein EHT25_16170 [Larkinella rosea]
MKKHTLQFAKPLFLTLLLSAPFCHARSTDPDYANSNEPSFDICMFMGAHQKVKLNLAVRQAKPVSVILRDARNTIMYRDFLKKSPTAYRLSFDFAASESGIYQLEISDGQRTIVRRVEVLEFPPIESSRHIVYNPQTSR